MAHPGALVGAGTGVADPAYPPAGGALALGVGAAVSVGSSAAVDVAVGTAVGQGWPLGTGSGVAVFPVGVAEGATADAEALGVADA